MCVANLNVAYNKNNELAYRLISETLLWYQNCIAPEI
jgi:hypothetical protein